MMEWSGRYPGSDTDGLSPATPEWLACAAAKVGTTAVFTSGSKGNYGERCANPSTAAFHEARHHVADPSIPGSSHHSKPAPSALASGPMPIHPSAQLSPLQRQLLAMAAPSLGPAAAVVVTNPLIKGNPIVWVSRPWETTCGFSHADALGRCVGSLMQGAQTDMAAVAGMATAVAQQLPFKAQLQNYKGVLEVGASNFPSSHPHPFPYYQTLTADNSSSHLLTRRPSRLGLTS